METVNMFLLYINTTHYNTAYTVSCSIYTTYAPPRVPCMCIRMYLPTHADAS